jgi:hypothetical protein
MLNEIEGLKGSRAAYVPAVGWNSIEGCYRSDKIRRGCNWGCGCLWQGGTGPGLLAHSRQTFSLKLAALIAVLLMAVFTPAGKALHEQLLHPSLREAEKRLAAKSKP